MAFRWAYEVFAGNTHDSKTLQTIVATMEARHGVVGRVWISDRGMASREKRKRAGGRVKPSGVLRSSVATSRGLANHYRSIARAPCPAAIASDFRQTRETTPAHARDKSPAAFDRPQCKKPAAFRPPACTKQ